MHSTAYEEVEKFAASLPNHPPLVIADVGAYNVCGCLRPIFAKNPAWTYHGLDMSAGPNVDIVVPADGKWENIADLTYDVVVSVSTLEHTKRPWFVMNEIGRILKTGGMACIVAPYAWHEHRFPVDCWRIFPDGMRVILEDAGLEVKEIHKRVFPGSPCCGDTIGVARKPVREDTHPGRPPLA
jgi:SAM-dependent methyltransferase